MKVSELKQWPKIYKLCGEYWDNDERSGQWGTEDISDLGDGFIWGDTPQGDDFWGALYDGDIEEAKSLQPHLFEEEEVDSEGFIKWSGGEMPVPEGTMVHVKYRDGRVVIITAGLKRTDVGYCRITEEGILTAINWKHNNLPWDIVAYKLHTGDGYVDGVKQLKGTPKHIIDANNTVIKTEFNPPKAGGSEYKITGTISLSEDRRSGAASLQEPHKPLIVESKLKYLKLGDEVLFDYRQDTPENNYTKQPLQDAYKAWAFSEPFGVLWLDGERKQLQEFKLNTRKALNKLAVQGLVGGDMITKFDELLKEI